jgi:hypothetical protein
MRTKEPSATQPVSASFAPQLELVSLLTQVLTMAVPTKNMTYP